MKSYAWLSYAQLMLCSDTYLTSLLLWTNGEALFWGSSHRLTNRAGLLRQATSVLSKVCKMATPTRQRSKNFSAFEVNLLLDLLTPDRVKVIESKKTDNAAVVQQKSTWGDVMTDFHAQGGESDRDNADNDTAEKIPPPTMSSAFRRVPPGSSKNECLLQGTIDYG